MTATVLHADFESRSEADLPKVGTDNYSKDPSTDIWCMGWAFDDLEPEIWYPGMELHPDVREHIEAGGTLVAHNASFEWYIWNRIGKTRYGWPTLKFSQTRCSMAACYAMALPGRLDKAAATLGLEQEKNMKGHRLMLQMCRPRGYDDEGNPIWWDDDDRKARLYDYCLDDVRTEQAIWRRVRHLPEDEQAVYLLDRRINSRGVMIDVPAAIAIKDAVAEKKEQLDAELSRVTGGMVKQATWVNVLTDWLRFQGVETGGVAKEDIRQLLARDDLDPKVRRALELRQEAGKTSTSKIDTMLRCRSDDDRVRDTMQYHGAAPGRWAGRKIQPQNFPRGGLSPEEVDHAIELFQAGESDLIELIYGDTLEVASTCLRGLLAAPEGRVFQGADFSNIEGRLLPWMAGEQWKLEAFKRADAGTGPEIYKRTASDITGVPIDQIDGKLRLVFGKVPELSLGFGGGAGAFDSMARVYDVHIADYFDHVMERTDEDVIDQAVDSWVSWGKRMAHDMKMSRKAWLTAECIKIVWRAKHPAIVQFWKDLEEAAVMAVENPGTLTRAGQFIHYKKKGSFLWCRLPCGRLICYPYPQIEERGTPWGTVNKTLTYKTENINKKWERTDTFGGKLSQNLTEAIGRDCLVHAMQIRHEAGAEIVMHVHDEIVEEVDEDRADLDAMVRDMEILPEWAPGLPLKAEGWVGKRFRKD